MNLAVIPARGGSKRIPRKNIRDFCGKPIIAYSIELALQSGLFDEVMVSTDDDEIAEISKKYGAKVPFMRSTKTADDFATTADVLFGVVSEYHARQFFPKYLCCLYPTAPLVSLDSLMAAFNKLLQNKDIDIILPVVRFSFPIQRALRFQEEKISFFNPEYILTRSQDLESAYHDAGQFYWARVKTFMERKSLFSEKTSGIVLSDYQVQDIDNISDWGLAELKYRLLYQTKNT